MASTGDAPPPPPQPEEITPDVLQRLASSTDTADKLLALTTIRDDPIIYTEVAPELYGLFTRSLLSDDVPLRSMSREAFLALAEHVGRVRDVPTVNSLFVPLSRYIISGEDLPSERPDDGSTLLTLTALAAAVPQALAPHIAAIVALCHQTVNSMDNDPATRQKSLTLLESLSENLPDSIPDKSLPEMVDSCLATMSSIDWGEWGNHDWQSGSETNQIEEASWGKDCLVQIVSNLHERSIVKVTIDQTCEYLQAGDWECRLAGVQGLEVIGTTGLIVMMDEIVMTLSHVLKDPDARIRVAAFKVLSLVAHNIGPNPGYLDDIVSVLIYSIADSLRRVANTAAETLLQFIQFYPFAISAHLDALISGIIKNLEEAAYMTDVDESTEQFIRAQLTIVKTLASASITKGSPAELLMERLVREEPSTSLRLSTDQFAGIYDRLIESLKWMLPNKYVVILALDCISRLAIAVGQSKFSADAPFVLYNVVPRLAFMHSEDSESALTSLRGVCLAMGDEMVPFLPLLMRPLFLISRYPAPPTMRGHDLYREGCRKIVMRIFEDFAMDHKDAFASYVPEVMKVVCSNMNSHSLRIPTMDFALLLECVKKDGVPAMRALWVPYLAALKGAIEKEDKKPFYAPIFYQFVSPIHQSMKKLGAEGLTAEDVDDVAWMITDALEKRQEGEYAKKSIRDFERSLYYLIIDLLNIEGVKSFNAVNSLMPHILSSISNLKYQMRIATEYICSSPQMALLQYDRISELILTALCDDRSDVRSEGFYAIRWIANLECPEWSPLIVNSIPSVIAALSRADARLNEDCIRATTRTLMAVAMIIYLRTKIDLARSSEVAPLTSSYVEWLLVNEVKEDADSSSFVYSVLSEFVRLKNPLVVGENNGNWPKIIRIMSRALTRGELGSTSYGSTVKDLLIEVLKKMKCEDEQLFNDSVSRAELSGEELANIMKILA